MKRLVLVPAMSCVALLAWTTPSSAGNTGAAGILHRAAQRTAQAHSFEMQLYAGAATIAYQAPDRFRTTEHGSTVSAGSGSGPRSAPQPSTIVKVYIGQTIYESDTPPGSFTKQTLEPGAASPANVLRLLRAVATSQNVSRSRAIYRFHITALAPFPNRPPLSAEGEATIASGYLKTMSLRFQGGGTSTAATASFTNINHASDIAAPLPTNVQP
jgi:hypothetical protein